MPTVRVAVLDLGSSSFHLMVVDAARDRLLTPVLRRRSFLHLGTEVASTGGIPVERAALAVRTVRRFRAAADEAGADLIVAVATAALRDASNGSEVLTRMERALGVPIRLLSGEDEARLCFMGQRAGVWVGFEPVLGLDLGGGSLEAVVGNVEDILAVTSASVGTARLRGELSLSDPMRPRDRAAVAAVTVERLTPVVDMLDEYPMARTRAIASGGTVRALARLAIGLHRPSPSAAGVEVNQVDLPAGQLHSLADRLCALPLGARLALPGVQARRAGLLPIGAVVLSTMVDSLGLRSVTVSDWGLREGAVVGALSLDVDAAPAWSTTA